MGDCVRACGRYGGGMRVVLIAAQSLDGRITPYGQTEAAFVSEADRGWFPACLREFDCSVMGAATYRLNRATLQARMGRVSRHRVVLSRDPAALAGDAIPGQLEFSSEAPGALLARLERAGLKHCALLGGGEINGLFLSAGLVAELWLTLEPCLLGDGQPLVACGVHVPLELRETQPLGRDVLLLKYRVAREAGLGRAQPAAGPVSGS
jgi:riboflavin biosynthesis pyrimidine reductase